MVHFALVLKHSFNIDWYSGNHSNLTFHSVCEAIIHYAG